MLISTEKVKPVRFPTVELYRGVLYATHLQLWLKVDREFYRVAGQPSVSDGHPIYEVSFRRV